MGSAGMLRGGLTSVVKELQTDFENQSQENERKGNERKGRGNWMGRLEGQPTGLGQENPLISIPTV